MQLLVLKLRPECTQLDLRLEDKALQEGNSLQYWLGRWGEDHSGCGNIRKGCDGRLNCYLPYRTGSGNVQKPWVDALRVVAMITRQYTDFFVGNEV